MGKKFLGLFLITATLFFSGCGDKEVKSSSIDSIESLAQQLADSMAGSDLITIAVVNFTDVEGAETTLGTYISEELITGLFMTRRFDIIERELLETVAEEQELSISGTIDETTAQDLGRILGVEALCTGTITDLGGSVKINGRLISTETGRIIAVASALVEKDTSMYVLLGETAETATTTVPASTTTDTPVTSVTSPGEVQYSFNVRNESGYSVYFIYVSPSDSDFWGEDFLEQRGVLYNGENFIVNVTEAPRGPNPVYDIQIEDEFGDVVELYEIDLSSISGVRVINDRNWTLQAEVIR